MTMKQNYFIPFFLLFGGCTVLLLLVASGCSNPDKERRQARYDLAVKEIKSWMKFPHTVRIATLTDENTDSCSVIIMADGTSKVTFDYHAENGLGEFVPDVARIVISSGRYSNGPKATEVYLSDDDWRNGKNHIPSQIPGIN